MTLTETAATEDIEAEFKWFVTGTPFPSAYGLLIVLLHLFVADRFKGCHEPRAQVPGLHVDLPDHGDQARHHCEQTNS